MSREAIAAALARDDLSCGERLVAFSLASVADRENRASSLRRLVELKEKYPLLCAAPAASGGFVDAKRGHLSVALLLVLRRATEYPGCRMRGRKGADSSSNLSR
jgi:hypothetical protein